MRRLLMVAALAACGCATTGGPLVQPIKVVETPKVVPVPCIKEADIPPPTPTAMPEPNPDLKEIGRKAAGASLDVHNLVHENERLRNLLKGCAQGDK